MLWWFVDATVGMSEVVVGAESELTETVATLGLAMGWIMILSIWGFGDIILGLVLYLTRAKRY